VSLIILENFGSLSIWPYLPSRTGHMAGCLRGHEALLCAQNIPEIPSSPKYPPASRPGIRLLPIAPPLS